MTLLMMMMMTHYHEDDDHDEEKKKEERFEDQPSGRCFMVVDSIGTDVLASS